MSTDKKTYEKFCEEMILRDFLALDRTILANKRTLLAYLRTSNGLLASGIGMVKLVTDGIINILGFILIVGALPVLIIGTTEYIKMQKTLHVVGKTDKIEIKNL
jgi:putative membrane protein